MVPDGMCKINFGQVPFHSLDHEGEAISVVCPVMWSVMNEDLFMGFDGACGAEVQPIVIGIPFCILPVFVQWVIGKSP